MAVINDRAFNLPGVRQRAMGHGRPKPIGVTGQPPGKTGGYLALATGRAGGRDADRSLRPETVGCRGRTSLSARGLFAGAAEGEWWLDQDEFDRIERHAEESGISIGHAIGTLLRRAAGMERSRHHDRRSAQATAAGAARVAPMRRWRAARSSRRCATIIIGW